MPNTYLLESVEGGAVRGRYSFLGLRPDLIWRCFGQKVELNRRALADADAAYDVACARLNDVVQQFQRNLFLDRRSKSVPATLPDPKVSVDEDGFHKMVDQAKEYIRAGDIFQVVLSQRYTLPYQLPPFAFYRALRRINPSPFMFYLDIGGFQVVGASPEILVRLRDGEVTITRRRGKTPDPANDDKVMAQDLLDDPKERSEHLMLLDLGRNDVGRLSKPGTVRVTDREQIEYYLFHPV